MRRTAARLNNQTDESGFYPGQQLTAVHNTTGNVITGVYGGFSASRLSIKIGNTYCQIDNYTITANNE